MTKKIIIPNEGSIENKLVYMKCIDDTIINAQEIWYHPDDGITYYFRKYENDKTCVVKVKDGVFLDFDMYKNEYDKIDALRWGYLRYSED